MIEDLNKYTTEQLRMYISKTGKKVNQNLTRLAQTEYANASRAYKYIEKQVFDNDDKDSIFRIDKVGYNLKTKGLSRNELLHKARQIQKTHLAKTSTISGVKKAYSKSTVSYNMKYGTKYTTAELGKIFESAQTISETANFSSTERVNIIKALWNKGVKDIDTQRKIIEDVVNEVRSSDKKQTIKDFEKIISQVEEHKKDMNRTGE